ncbi:hypothetical protein Hypma_000656 [Hypsizygus marmoreus]|uniref:Uncharacterized protein n=1 Tax=Hypsizygus marmoreus TaxID=39966 RepID=A0A369J7V5_HYPMA|nr:hypothetical protein Hypma_000656 [Hypsizygus marmoreus]
MHSDATLGLLDMETTVLGDELRLFHAVSTMFNTKELKREAEARNRKQARSSKKQGSAREKGSISAHKGNSTAQGKSSMPEVNGDNSDGEGSASEEAPSAKPARRKKKKFSLNTYKNHAFGDYVETIRRYGTTESFSTELGELEHRNPKGKYKRTSRKAFTRQLAQIERRQARIRRMRQSISHRDGTSGFDAQHDEAFTGAAAIFEHHQIGLAENDAHHLGQFLRIYLGDPAAKDFLPRLKQHIAHRLEATLCKENSSESDIGINVDNIFFNKDLMYRHNIMRINYTTYDV